MFLGGGRKPENLEETNTDMARTFQRVTQAPDQPEDPLGSLEMAVLTSVPPLRQYSQIYAKISFWYHITTNSCGCALSLK